MEPGETFGDAFDPVRAVSHGWQAARPFLLVLWVGGAVKACTEVGANTGIGNQDGRAATEAQRFVEAMGVGLVAAVAIGVALVLVMVRALILPGWIRLHRSILEEAHGEFSMLFLGADRFLPMLGWLVVRFLVLGATVLVAAAPGIGLVLLGGPFGIAGAGLAVLLAAPAAVYVGLGLVFGAHAVTIEERGPIDALTRSWELADGNRWTLLWFVVVLVVVELVTTLAGVCLLCVGALVTRPLGLAVVDMGFTESFLLHTLPREETRRWKGPQTALPAV